MPYTLFTYELSMLFYMFLSFSLSLYPEINVFQIYITQAFVNNFLLQIYLFSMYMY